LRESSALQCEFIAPEKQLLVLFEMQLLVLLVKQRPVLFAKHRPPQPRKA